MGILRGLQAITFKCPKCGGDTFGFENEVGHCRRVGHTRATDCNFTWSRRHDWRVFVRVADGSGFRTPVELEAFVADASAAPVTVPAGARPAFPELLQGLLAELMASPPTLAVVERWTRAEWRDALHWASREVLADDAAGVDVAREPRPSFIEDGAATA